MTTISLGGDGMRILDFVHIARVPPRRGTHSRGPGEARDAGGEEGGDRCGASWVERDDGIGLYSWALSAAGWKEDG